MNHSAIDVHQTKTYGGEKLGRQNVFFAGALVVAGGLGISLYDASSSRTTISWVIAALGLAWAVYELVIRPAAPGKPLLELSPDGITLRTVGDVFIPWREVHSVESVDMTIWPGQTAPLPVKLSNLTVVLISRDFYDAKLADAAPLVRDTAWQNTFIPTERAMQVSFHHDVLPVEPDALRAEIAARWHAFGAEERPAAAPPPPAKKVAFRINWGKK